VLVLWRRGDESAKFEWLPTKWDSGSSNQSRYANAPPIRAGMHKNNCT
jgi:hypothetical protein